MKKVKFWAAAAILCAILLCPETAVAGAQAAMRLWCTSVAPALFPFLALLPMLTGQEACAAYEAVFSKIMRPLFGLPGVAAPAVIVGMVSGSPGGALAVRRVAGEGGMRAADAKRIALVLGGVSPAYLVMGVGQALYGSAALGAKLAVIQILVQLTLLILLRGAFEGGERIVEKPPESETQHPIRMAVENLLAICGYMVLFSVIAAVLAGFMGRDVGTALLLVLDLPSGLAQLAGSDISGKLLIQGAAIGFGGLCIMAQNMDALQSIGVKWREYLAVRCIEASMVACACVVSIHARTAVTEIVLGNPMGTYTFSLLVASAAAVPGLFFLSRKLFLNK